MAIFLRRSSRSLGRIATGVGRSARDNGFQIYLAPFSVTNVPGTLPTREPTKFVFAFSPTSRCRPSVPNRRLWCGTSFVTPGGNTFLREVGFLQERRTGPEGWNDSRTSQGRRFWLTSCGRERERAIR